MALGWGCGGVPQPEAPEAPEPEARASRRPLPSGASISAEVGALDENDVKKVYRSAAGQLRRCITEGMRRLPFLEGEIQIFLRIKTDGSVRWSFPLNTSFGDLGTERCIVRALRAKQWPKPQGGEEGETTQRFSVETDARRPAAWAARDLGRAKVPLQRALASCRRRAGTQSLAVTFYVGTNGRALSAGAAVGDPQGISAIDCAVKAVRAQRFPKPGSYPAKVTLFVSG